LRRAFVWRLISTGAAVVIDAVAELDGSRVGRKHTVIAIGAALERRCNLTTPAAGQIAIAILVLLVSGQAALTVVVQAITQLGDREARLRATGRRLPSAADPVFVELKPLGVEY
jgi:hypothetical protein